MATVEEFVDHARFWQQAGALAQAEQCYRDAVELDPKRLDAHYELGNLLAREGRFEAAADCYRIVLRLEPDHAEAHNNLGVMFAEQKQATPAIAAYQQAIRIRPDYAEAHYNLGNILKDANHLDEAVASYRQALHWRPGFAGAHLNLGIVLAHLGCLTEAVTEYHEASRLVPDWPEAYNNLGLAYSHLDRDTESLELYERALRLRPDFADAHYNRALSWLALGDLERGWPEFEWRWRLAELPPRQFAAARWDGASLAGRAILLHAEQGLGDTIQFIRFARIAKETGATVLVECQRSLLPLLAGCRGVDGWIGRGDPLPAFDLHFPLMSLGGVFARTVASIPAEVPYLEPAPARVERWRDVLAGIAGFKIGIAWQGSPGYRWDRLRSIPLAAFAPLAALPGVRLVSLQKGPGAEQLAGPHGFDVIDLGKDLDNDGAAFMDTAAAVCGLDLIVTSDTALAHLAGALARPVWVALPLAAEWRWLREPGDSPWYPSMRLFRQTKHGDWADVFQRISDTVASNFQQ